MPDPPVFDEHEFAPAFDENEFASKPVQASSVAPASSGFLDSVSSYIPQGVKDFWDWSSKPVTDVVSRAGTAVSDYLEPTQYGTYDPRRYLFEYPEALGRVATDTLLTPQGLALTAASGGAGAAERAGLVKTGQALRYGMGAAGAPMVASGAQEMYNAPHFDEKLMGAANVALGAMGVHGAFAGEHLPVKPAEASRPGYIMKEPIIDETAAALAEHQAKANEIIKKSPAEQAQPEQPKIPESQAIAQEQQQAQQPQFTQSLPQAGGATLGEAKAAADAAQPASELPPEATQLEQQIPPEMMQSFQTEGGFDPNQLQGLEKTPTTTNASGESAASAEALSRQATMRSRGEQYVVYDKAGKERPLIGPEAVDYTPQNGETYGIKTPRGFVKLEDRGGKVPEGIKTIIRRAKEGPGYKGTINDQGEIVSEPQPALGTAADKANELRTRLDDAINKVPTKQHPAYGPTESIKEIAQIAKEVGDLPDSPEKDTMFRRVLGAQKAVLTAWDLSAPGRQGKAFITNKEWWTSLDDMAKAWGSANAAHMVQDSIENHPSGLFKHNIDANGKTIPSFADRAGLDLAGHEEIFNHKLAKRLDIGSMVERSSRAHTAFLNKLRSDIFAKMIEESRAAGRDPAKEFQLAKAYAKFINDATGRGSLNIGDWKLENNAKALNDVFFAPRNMSGQIRTWNAVLNPMRYASYDPVLRKQALRSLFAVAGLGLMASTTAKLAGGKVGLDPTSADFLKLRIGHKGNTRVDWFGGYGQFPVLAAKLLTGQSTSTTTNETTDLSSGRFGRENRASVAERFFTNRLAPFPSFVWAWMQGREFDGKPFEVKRALFERTFPIALHDIVSMAKEDPFMAGVFATPTFLGLTNTQTYSGR